MLPALRKRSTFPNLVDEFFGRELFPGFLFETDKMFSTPAVNVIEGKEDFRIEVAAPGLDKSDFRIELDHNVLTVSSEKEQKSEDQDEHFMRKEFNYLNFSRSFSLPDIANTEQISASHKDGILTITIPKKDEAKVKPAKQISIQ